MSEEISTETPVQYSKDFFRKFFNGFPKQFFMDLCCKNFKKKQFRNSFRNYLSFITYFFLERWLFFSATKTGKTDKIMMESQDNIFNYGSRSMSELVLCWFFQKPLPEHIVRLIRKNTHNGHLRLFKVIWLCRASLIEVF